MQKAPEAASVGPVSPRGEPLTSTFRLLLVLLVLLPAGCVRHPVAHSEALAEQAGARQERLAGAGFEHVVFTRGMEGADGVPGAALHIYLGGDGRAFLSRHRVAADPTPARPLALELMLADPAPAAYVARPCYHGAVTSPACSPVYWTTSRFAPAVIGSVAAVVSELAARMPAAEVTLIGYSGGGVVALLAAARVPRVQRVVTLAAPLDLAAWTSAHDYTPLFESIDPARRTDWPPTLTQVHVHGGRDGNVTPDMVAGFREDLAASDLPATFRVLDGFDHVCCWRQHWPELLDTLLTGHWPPSHAKL